MKEISLYIMAILYILAGVNHFYQPKFYMRIMPPYIPWHKFMVYLSGAIEILLGILLMIPACSSLAAWGIIALLIAVFPANVYHLTSSKPGGKFPMWALYLRLPLQGALMLWAYWYT